VRRLSPSTSVKKAISRVRRIMWQGNSLFIVLLSFAMSSKDVTAEESAGAPQPGIATVRAESLLTCNLRWSVDSLAGFTQYDSVVINSYLANSTSKTMQFDSEGGPSAPLLVVKRDGTTLKQQRLAWNKGTRSLELNRVPGKFGHFHVASFDLRGFYDTLEFGEYEVNLVWPADDYQITGCSAKRENLVSPTVKFSLTKTDSPKFWGHADVLSVAEPVCKGSILPACKFTNTLKTDIALTCYKKGAERTYVAPIDVLRWTVVGWESFRIAPRVRDGIEVVLKPGESVEISPDDRIMDLDGAYAYAAHISIKGDPPSRQHVGSNVFFIDKSNRLK
jgi:hypothetical protein